MNNLQGALFWSNVDNNVRPENASDEMDVMALELMALVGVNIA